MSAILVTGAAGFIGFHVTRRLLERGDRVVGVDNFNAYYDVSLKESRFKILEGTSGFEGRRMDLADRSAISRLFDKLRFDGPKANSSLPTT